jgi:hypothetical protein
MTPEESQMLNDLADKIAKTPSPAHDAEAEQFIRTRIGSRPDALYIMTQTVLIQNMAIEHARQQIQELQQRVAQSPGPAAPAGGSFVDGGRQQPGYAAAPPPPPPSYAQAPPPAYEPPPSGGISSFLRSAATTAAGVAAGALAFEGIRSLFGGGMGGGMGGFGGGFGGGGMHGSSFLGDAPGSETIINNYYDSPEQGGREALSSDDSDTTDGGEDLAGQDDDNAAQSDDDADNPDDSGDTAGDDGDGGGDDGGGDDGGGGGDDGGGGGDWA